MTLKPSQAEPGVIAQDPVCGMQVRLDSAHASALHNGITYHFCQEHCRTRFLQDPARYLAPPAPTADVPLTANARYTCPMHPQVHRTGPGQCPECGMALEPETPSAAAGDSPELLDMRRRCLGAALLTVPLVLMAMALMFYGAHSSPLRLALQAVLSTPVVFVAGWPLLKRAWDSLLPGRAANMYTLIGLGVLASYGMSLVSWLWPAWVPAAFCDAHGALPVYFESAATIITLVLLGQWLELAARARTGEALRELLTLQPAEAIRLTSCGHERTVPLADVAVGDRLRVRPGARVPVDGRVLEGASTVDESMVTGESVPVTKAAGDAVYAGTLNERGTLIFTAEQVGSSTLVARIVASVAAAQRSRAPIQSLADRVSAWFVPAVAVAAAVAALAWLLLGPEPRVAHALLAGVSVLVIACPCALGLATPMAIMVAMGRGAQAGVLFRHADALERLQAVDTLVLDKTGTLTEGHPAVVAVTPAVGVDEREVLRVAAAIEQLSEHPLARAILNGAAQRGIEAPTAHAFVALPGAGATAMLDGEAVWIGRRTDAPAGALAEAAAAPDAALSQVAVARAGRLLGVIAIRDPLRAEAPQLVERLQAQGLQLVLLSGDAAGPAQAVATALGIREVHAGALPEEKAAVIRALRAEGRRVAMAGDGLNDAPALAAADVGIAMGSGTDLAIETAGVTLLRGDLAALERAWRLSRATVRNIRQNLWLAFVYNGLGIPLAAGLLYPLTGALLSPMLAAAAMSLSSVSVIGNALRLRRLRL